MIEEMIGILVEGKCDRSNDRGDDQVITYGWENYTRVSGASNTQLLATCGHQPVPPLGGRPERVRRAAGARDLRC